MANQDSTRNSDNEGQVGKAGQVSRAFPESKKRCSSCGDEIPKSAIVCRQCGNYQGRWWLFRLFGLGLPWFTVIFAVVAFLVNQYKKSEENVFIDVHAFLQSFNGDDFSIDVINSMSTPIFLADPRLSCKRSSEYWFEFSRPGFEAPLLPEGSVPGQLGPGDFRNLTYRLGPGIDRRKLSSTRDVSCTVWFYYTGVYPGGLMSGLSGQGLFPVLQDKILDAFLRRDRWP